MPFVRLARTIRRHRHGILASIRLGLSNGAWKGLNSRISLISHRSCGFHALAPLVPLVYLCCAAIVISLPRRPSPPNRSEHPGTAASIVIGFAGTAMPAAKRRWRAAHAG